MTTVRTPTDEDEKERFDDAVRRGLAVSLEDFIEVILGRVPEEDLVNAIRLGIEAHTEISGNDEPLDMKEFIIQFAQWQEFAS